MSTRFHGSRLRAALVLAILTAACAGAKVGSGNGNHGSGSDQGSGGDGSSGGGGAIVIDLDAGTKPTPVGGTGGYVRPPTKNFPETSSCTGKSGPLAEALQKALWFLNVQKSGSGVLSTNVQWRGDAHTADAHIKLDPASKVGVNLSQAFINANKAILDPSGTGEVDLSGGYHDAGDYIKFGITTAFTAHMLAWSLFEFPDSYRTTGLENEALMLLRWANDYFMKSTFLDGSGNVVAFAHQVGDGTDHTCGWMPPELRRPDFCPRKGYFTSEETPAADVTAGAAASLAITSLLQAKDAGYAQKALKLAQALYAFAAKHPTSVAATSDGLYTSEYAADDLAWAAVWLYLATNKSQYIDDILGPSGNGGGWLDMFPGFRTTCMQSANANCWTESHTQVWNSLRSGVFIKMAQILRDQNHRYADGMRIIARKDSMKWADGTVSQTPAGFSVLSDYGSARYNSAAQFVALLYAKHFGDGDTSAKSAITTWAKRQIDYILGNNPLKKSYMMGFTNNYANQPHHAAGHASICGQPGMPRDNRHVIWGALVNGPDGNDGHIDDRNDFGSNEITIDYNTSLIAALSAHYALSGNGQCPLAKFPVDEPVGDEYYTMSSLNGAGACRSQVTITLLNETLFPPRYNTHLSLKYFFDISELQANGGTIGDVTASLIYDRGKTEFGEPTTISQPKPCPKSSSTYYVDIGFEGYQFWGRVVQLKAPRTIMIDIGTNNGASCTWDPSNDWSYDKLQAAPTSGAGVCNNTPDPPKTPHIPVYSSGSLAWGEEPTCLDEEVRPPPPPVWIP